MITSAISKQGLIETTASTATLLMRILVGGIFLSEAVQKFLVTAERGACRFAIIGIPYPQAVAPAATLFAKT